MRQRITMLYHLITYATRNHYIAPLEYLWTKNHHFAPLEYLCDKESLCYTTRLPMRQEITISHHLNTYGQRITISHHLNTYATRNHYVTQLEYLWTKNHYVAPLEYLCDKESLCHNRILMPQRITISHLCLHYSSGSQPLQPQDPIQPWS